jgi:hypothetical protein
MLFIKGCLKMTHNEVIEEFEKLESHGRKLRHPWVNRDRTTKPRWPEHEI